MLTIERLKELFLYDSETGLFTDLKRNRYMLSLSPDGYVRIRIGNKNYAAHRLAWLYHHGAWPTELVDHINGDRSDNRIINLRDVPAIVNAQNKHQHNKRTRSGVYGVSASKQRFKASIIANGKRTNLGTFDTSEGARDAYLSAKAQLHPEARIPTPDPIGPFSDDEWGASNISMSWCGLGIQV